MLIFWLCRWAHGSCQGLNSDEDVENAADEGFDCTLCRMHTMPTPGKIHETWFFNVYFWFHVFTFLFCFFLKLTFVLFWMYLLSFYCIWEASLKRKLTKSGCLLIFMWRTRDVFLGKINRMWHLWVVLRAPNVLWHIKFWQIIVQWSRLPNKLYCNEIFFVMQRKKLI